MLTDEAKENQKEKRNDMRPDYCLFAHSATKTHVDEKLTLKINTRYLIRNNFQNMIIQVSWNFINMRRSDSFK
jgi:hypothetical protein